MSLASCANALELPPTGSLDQEVKPIAERLDEGVLAEPDQFEVTDLAPPPEGECVEELCDGQDNDCDSVVDEALSCPCSQDTTCYGGPPATRSVGACQDGERACSANGETWLSCEGWTPPTDELCDLIDNDCDGETDEGLLNACGACGELPVESCDGQDNDCDGEADEGLLNACGACGELPVESCDGLDNDCDGQTDEGTLNACGACGPAPTEVCDLLDNDCDGVVDEQGCVVADLDIDGDCITVSCPPEAPHPIACEINFQGGDPRGCVAYRQGESTVYLQEGNQCGAGRVTGTLTCSNLLVGDLDANTCPINKSETFYPNRPRGCPDTN